MFILELFFGKRLFCWDKEEGSERNGSYIVMRVVEMDAGNW